MDERVGGDAISGDVKDSNSVVIGKDIQQDTTTATGNNVTVNVPSWMPGNAHGQDESRGISVTVEESLRRELADLRSTITALSVSVGQLNVTLALETQNLKARLEAESKRAQESMEAIDKLAMKLGQDRPIFDGSTRNLMLLIAAAVLFFLGVITYVMVFGGLAA